MLFLYHNDAGAPSLSLDGDAHRYLFKVRRHKAGETVALRNLRDGMRYIYRIENIDRKRALLVLEASEHDERRVGKTLHLGWCVIDPKSIEKTLPTLNELGVARITFIYCERSQKNFKIDFTRLEKILINSCQQCGRTDLMRLETCASMETFVRTHPDARLLDFSSRVLDDDNDIGVLVIGCEGGITPDERNLFAEEYIVGFDTPLVLRSESAACAAAAKVLI